MYTILGPEFGTDEGKLAVIFQALYRFKSGGASLRNHLDDCMKHIGYKPSIADPDMRMIPKTRKT